MKANDNKQEPILVKNPQTGKYLDINPLLTFINGLYNGKVQELIEDIDDSIKYTSLNSVNEDNEMDPLDYKTTIYTLYGLRDAIKGLIKFKEGGE